MPKTVMLVLNRAEDAALLEMAKQDIRPPAEQIRWLVITEAQRRGLIPATNSNRAGVLRQEDTASAVADSITLQSRP